VHRREHDQPDPALQPFSNQQMLLAFLAEQDASCPACGYNLRQLTRPSCPECGLSLVLSVGSHEPFRRAWAITLCLTGMVAGIGMMFSLLVMAEGVPRIYDLHAIWLYGPIASIPLPFILFGLRNKFCGCSSAAQRWLAIASACWLVMIAGALAIDLF